MGKNVENQLKIGLGIISLCLLMTCAVVIAIIRCFLKIQGNTF